MRSINISVSEIKQGPVYLVDDTTKGNITPDIIEQWDRLLNSAFTSIIAGSSARPATTSFPATSLNTGRGSVIDWDVKA